MSSEESGAGPPPIPNIPRPTPQFTSPPRPSENRRTFSQAILRSIEAGPDYLYDTPDPLARRHLSHMAKYLGLESSAAVRDWMNSPVWKPHWQEYYEASVNPRLVQYADPNYKGEKSVVPKLSEIQMEMISGEANGRCKYSGPNIDKTGWKDLEHAALALYRMTRDNLYDPMGVFRSRQMSPSAVHVRMWLPVPREVNKARKALKNRDQPGSLKYLLPHQVPGKVEQLPVQEMTDEGQGGSPALPTAELDEDIQGLSDASSENTPAKRRKLTHVN